MASSSSNVVGVHYRVGKKIGEGSFGVIFEGTNLLNNQQVAIKFVSILLLPVPAIGYHPRAEGCQFHASSSLSARTIEADCSVL